jgi:flagellar motor switch protein FliM
MVRSKKPKKGKKKLTKQEIDYIFGGGNKKPKMVKHMVKSKKPKMVKHNSSILSQKEIDYILNNKGNKPAIESILEGEYIPAKDATVYDFRRPNRFSKNQLRTLQSIHESFAESLSYYLSSRLQMDTNINVYVTGIDQLFYSEYILSIANPGCLYVFDLGMNDGKAILEFSSQLAFVLIDLLLGGKGERISRVRSLCQIERSVLKGIFERTLIALQSAWKKIGDFNFKYERFESEADLIQIAPPNEVVFVATFEVIIADIPFLMNLCVPSFAIEEVIANLKLQHLLSSANMGKSGIRQEVLSSQILDTKVQVTGILDKIQLTIGELLELEVGKVINLNKETDPNIEILINDKCKFLAKMETVDGYNAAKIDSKYD